MDISNWLHYDTKLGLQKDLYWQEKYKAMLVMELSTRMEMFCSCCLVQVTWIIYLTFSTSYLRSLGIFNQLLGISGTWALARRKLCILMWSQYFLPHNIAEIIEINVQVTEDKMFQFCVTFRSVQCVGKLRYKRLYK